MENTSYVDRFFLLYCIETVDGIQVLPLCSLCSRTDECGCYQGDCVSKQMTSSDSWERNQAQAEQNTGKMDIPPQHTKLN